MKIDTDKLILWLQNERGLREKTIKEYLYYCNKFCMLEAMTQPIINDFIKRFRYSFPVRGFMKNLLLWMNTNKEQTKLMGYDPEEDER